MAALSDRSRCHGYECPRVDRVRRFMAWLCTSTALAVALIVMARASHLFGEYEGAGPIQTAMQAVGICAVVITALSLVILYTSA